MAPNVAALKNQQALMAGGDNAQIQKKMLQEKMQKDLKEMDYRGSFESDDETGVIFKQIQTTINQLTRFRGEEQ